MRPGDLVIRCFAEKIDDQWVGVSLEFGLAAQGDSLAEVKAKLDAQIREYVNDALVGEDRAHARYLLSRRASLREHLRYYCVLAKCHLFGRQAGPKARTRLFTETLHLQPA